LKDNVLSVKDKLTSGIYEIDGTVSSQFITGLLFALPLLDGDSKIEIKGELTSKAYIDITLDIIKKFGIQIINENYTSFIIKGNQNLTKGSIITITHTENPDVVYVIEIQQKKNYTIYYIAVISLLLLFNLIRILIKNKKKEDF
jgi:hypothetical protein